MPTFLLTLREVLARTGPKKSAHYLAIKNGLFVKPVSISKRSRRYPDFEVDAIIAARIAGKPDAEIRALVVALEAARKAAA